MEYVWRLHNQDDLWNRFVCAIMVICYDDGSTGTDYDNEAHKEENNMYI